MLAGIAAAAVALGVTELVAVAFGPQADARTAVGSAVIDLTHGPVKEWAIQTFGTADKLALSILVLGVMARKQISQTREEGDGLALAGIIVGSIVTGIWLLVIVLWIVAFASITSSFGP